MWRDAEMINKTYDAVEQVETQGRRSIAGRRRENGSAP